MPSIDLITSALSSLKEALQANTYLHISWGIHLYLSEGHHFRDTICELTSLAPTREHCVYHLFPPRVQHFFIVSALQASPLPQHLTRPDLLFFLPSVSNTSRIHPNHLSIRRQRIAIYEGLCRKVVNKHCHSFNFTPRELSSFHLPLDWIQSPTYYSSTSALLFLDILLSDSKACPQNFLYKNHIGMKITMVCAEVCKIHE